MSDVRKWYIGVYGGEAQARTCSPHPNEVIRDCEGDTFVLSRDYMAREAELKEGIAKHWQVICDQRAKIDALQQRLTAADERADTATSLIQRIVANFDTEIECHEDVEPNDLEHDQVLSEMREFLSPKDTEWRMNPCKNGHRDVGAAGGVAHCYTCDEKLTAANTQETFEQWNATHPAT